MNRFKTYIVFFFLPVCTAFGQIEIRKGDPIICNIGEEAHAGVQQTSDSKSKDNRSSRITSFNSVFEVRYFGFPPDAEAAVQKAIDIWASTLKSDVKILVFANWTVNATSPNNLAFVVPTETRGFKNSPNAEWWYPMTLAEKLAQTDLNSTGEADIVATFNSGRTDWYLGTDGVPHAGKFDLVSIALHELGHGLGFTGTFVANTSAGFYGANGTTGPKVYDTFIEDQTGNDLVGSSLYPNGSAALKTAISNSSVYFNSPMAMLLNGTPARPRLYAPSPYEGGSSISHLDETTYPKGSINSLMTPFADFAEVEHNPGPIAKGMFYDMGWLYTYLKHTDLHDQESMTSVTFDLDIKSDTTLSVITPPKLFYSYDAFATPLSVDMNFISGNKWSASIPSPIVEKTISYYFKVNDIFEKTYRYPQGAGTFVQFYYGVDTQAPVIAATVPAEINEFQKLIPVSALVTDNVGVLKVEFEYQVNAGTLKKITLPNTTGNTYASQLDLTLDNIHGGDVIKYRIIGTDVSSQANVANFPVANFSTINVKLYDVQTTYLSTFNSSNTDFYGDFSIGTPVGFSNGAIHSPHPYLKSGSGTPVSISHLLLYPIKINASNSFFYFDEVVLVEPGNDFVVVEGSKDNGITWQQITTPYSASKNTDWLTYYNGNIVSGDSKAIGTLNYYRSNKINLLSTFAANDVVFFRFRLSSNNANNGWGWAIDNLAVQDPATGLNEPTQISASAETVLYPNPVINKLNIASAAQVISVDVYSVTGQRLDIPVDGNTMEMGSLPQGIYLVRMNFGDGSTLSKKIIKK